MNISPEEAQKLTNMQSRMLSNIQAGKPAHEGITEEELSECLSFIRKNRAASALDSAAKPKAKRGAKAKKPAVEVDTKFFGDFDFG